MGERVPGAANTSLIFFKTIFQLELSENRDFFSPIKIHGTPDFHSWSPWRIH